MTFLRAPPSTHPIFLIHFPSHLHSCASLLLRVLSSAPSFKSQDCSLPQGSHELLCMAWRPMFLFMSHSRAICPVRRDFFFFFPCPRVLRSQSCFMILIATITRTCLRFQLLASCEQAVQFYIMVCSLDSTLLHQPLSL